MIDTFFIGTRKSRLAWAAAQQKYMKPGGLTVLQIQHDDFCKVFTRKNYCNCNPTRVLKDCNGRVLALVRNVGSHNPIDFGRSESHD